MPTTTDYKTSNSPGHLQYYVHVLEPVQPVSFSSVNLQHLNNNAHEVHLVLLCIKCVLQSYIDLSHHAPLILQGIHYVKLEVS